MSKEFHKWGAIMRADMTLVGVNAFGMTNDGGGAKYQGVEASFCKLDWEQYKANPPLLPMFRVLVSSSEIVYIFIFIVYLYFRLPHILLLTPHTENGIRMRRG